MWQADKSIAHTIMCIRRRLRKAAVCVWLINACRTHSSVVVFILTAKHMFTDITAAHKSDNINTVRAIIEWSDTTPWELNLYHAAFTNVPQWQ